MSNGKGWLLLDVDGPLNPYDCKPGRPPEGFASWRWLPTGEWLPGKVAKRRYTSRILRHGLLVRLNPGHGQRLLALAEAAGLQLAWASTWQDEAVELIGPTIGLPALPIVRFGPDLIIHDDRGRSWRPHGSWKYRAVAEFTDGAPLAWFDDEFGTRDHVAAREAFLAERAGIPTLLHQVSPATGITDDDLTAVADWASALA